MLIDPGSVPGSKPGPKISPRDGTAQFMPLLVSCPCVTSASGGQSHAAAAGMTVTTVCCDRDRHALLRLPRAHDPLRIPQGGAVCRGAGGRAGGPAPSGHGGEVEGCPGAARRGAPVGSTRVYSSEGELMQFPSSCCVSGAARAAGGKGVIKGSLEISSHTSPMAGTHPSTPAMLGVRSQPGGFGKRGWRDRDSG